MIASILLMLLVSFSYSCLPAAEDKPAAKVPGKDPLPGLVFLLFKAEQIAEIREADGIHKLIGRYQAVIPANLLPGIFDIDSLSNNQLYLPPTNEFYSEKGYLPVRKPGPVRLVSDSSVTGRLATTGRYQAIVFPSDLRNGGTFPHCFACPHWMAEVYGFLELLTGQFPLPAQKE